MDQMRKHIDFKSVLIGILGTMLAVVLVGANDTPKNIGDIVVRSIRVEQDSDGNGGYIKTYGKEGNLACEMGEDPFLGWASFTTYNKEGNRTTYLGTGLYGQGDLTLHYPDGTLLGGFSLSTTMEGNMSIYNSAGKLRGSVGVAPDGDGFIVLWNRYDGLGWIQSGE